MHNPLFSIILPFYKQRDHAKEVVKDYIDKLNNANIDYELLAVVNGVDDGTVLELNTLAKKYPQLKVFFVTPGGWGKAVRFGLDKTKGKFFCYTNSARTQIDDLIQILKIAEHNNDTLVKASRVMRESFMRKIGSILYNFEARMLLKTAVWDINGTPKILPTVIAKEIGLTKNDDLIDAELIARCVQEHVRILEVPVFITKRHGGKSTTNYKSALRMYRGIWELYKMYEKKRSLGKTI